jgi:pimeloyl-ACP methyl ester carboxylesterase
MARLSCCCTAFLMTSMPMKLLPRYLPQQGDAASSHFYAVSDRHGSIRRPRHAPGSKRLGADLLALMDALAIPKAVLAGYDWGGRAACIVAALWPERVHGLVSSGNGYNIQNIARAGIPAPPEEEYRFWYQYYFNSERGRAGLTVNRQALCRLLWRLWSPTWAFDDATFARSAASFDNPDFVEIVIHSYRHRYGGIAGDPALDAIENRLAAQPSIKVPSIVLEGGDDGVDPPTSPDRDAPHFAGPYEQRLIAGAGHNLPQELPSAFADAVLAVSP